MLRSAYHIDVCGNIYCASGAPVF